VADDFKLTRFEQELIRHLRALPFGVQQHVSRYILKLQREQFQIISEDLVAEDSPLMNLAPDEIAQVREAIRRQLEDED